jgi:hypothetical protein
VFEGVTLATDLPIAFDQVLTAPPYQFTVTIPADVPQHSYMLTAFGAMGPGQGAFSNTIVINVRRADDPTILKVEPSSPYLTVGTIAPVRVTGTFSDGSKIVINGKVGIPVTVPPLVSVVPATRALYAGQTLQLTAHVTMRDESVTWSASPAGIGTLTSTGFYTAPAKVKSRQQITIVATSVADATKSAAATITLYPRQ